MTVRDKQPMKNAPQPRRVFATVTVAAAVIMVVSILRVVVCGFTVVMGNWLAH